MKRWMGAVVAVALAIAALMTLGACAGTSASSSGSSGSLSTQEGKLEVGECTGTLVMAFQNEMTVASDQGDVVLATTKDTVYDLADLDEMYLDDIVTVKYHVDGDSKVADQVILVEHMDTAIEFAGTLVDSDDESLTLSDGSLTATFQKDSETYLVGDLSQGDGIELTYLGDLNEYPYANVVAVVNEAAQPETVTVHGAVSEVAGGTLLLGVDSAHAYRFAVTGNTTVTGVANDVRAGDRVDITFKGAIKNTPEAQTINIVKQGQDRAFVINGKIVEVKKDSVTLATDKAKYVFATTDKTVYRGEKPANGYNAEIQYTGALGDKPVAGSVYCVKDAKAASKATAKKQSSKTGARTNSSAAAEPISSKDKKSESAGGATPTETQSSGAAEPEASSEAAVEPEESSEAAVEPESEESVEPEGEESAEPEAEPESEAEEATEPEPEPEAEGAPEPDMKVSGQGTIVMGDEANQAVDITMKNGESITLYYDANTKIASGYIPQQGDVVKVVYGSSSMILKEIQLVSRPSAEQPKAEAKTEAKADKPKAEAKADKPKAAEPKAEAEAAPAEDDEAEDSE